MKVNSLSEQKHLLLYIEKYQKYMGTDPGTAWPEGEMQSQIGFHLELRSNGLGGELERNQ